MVAKNMGISLQTWNNVEGGLIALEDDKLDKFLSICEPDNAKQIVLDRTFKMNSINDFFANGEAKELMQKRGYNQNTLSEKCNIDNAVVSRIISKNNGTDDNKEIIYDFLHDCLNTNVEQKSKKKTKKIVTEMPVVEVKTPETSATYDELVEENKALKKQIERYNKLIDRMA